MGTCGACGQEVPAAEIVDHMCPDCLAAVEEAERHEAAMDEGRVQAILERGWHEGRW